MKFSSSVILVSRSLGLTSICLLKLTVELAPLKPPSLASLSSLAKERRLDFGVLATVLKASFLKFM